MMESTKDKIQAFKLLFVLNTLNPLNSQVEDLKRVAGGGQAQNETWKGSEPLSSTMTWTEFKDTVLTTLGSIDVIALVSHIKKVDVATFNAI